MSEYRELSRGYGANTPTYSPERPMMPLVFALITVSLLGTTQVPLETATYVSDLVTTNPAGSDPLAKSSDHIRLIKAALKNTLGATGPLVNAAGQLITNDGTASAPSHSFASEVTLGLYRAAAGEMAIAGRMVGQGAMPIGSLMDFAGTTAPAGYLACNGQLVSRTTYAELFAAIGTTWGAGDGSTTFAIPNLIDRYRRHAGGGHGGAVGTLQDPDVLPHTHPIIGSTVTESASHTHTFSGTTGGMNANNPHNHGVVAPTSGSSTGGGSFAASGGLSNTSTNQANIDHGHPFSGTTSTEGALHAHSINFTSGSAGASETRPYSACVLTCIRVL